MPDSFTLGIVTSNFKLRVTDHHLRSEALVSVRKPPGGNVVVVDLGGPGVERLPVTLTCLTPTDYANLVTLRGQQGTLIYAEAPAPTGRQAILGDLDRFNYLPGGQRQVQTEFILL